MRIIILIALLLKILQCKISYNSCLTCARSSNYFCTDPKMFDNPWDVQCCYQGSSNINCKEKYDIKCSEPFSISKS